MRPQLGACDEFRLAEAQACGLQDCQLKPVYGFRVRRRVEADGGAVAVEQKSAEVGGCLYGQVSGVGIVVAQAHQYGILAAEGLKAVDPHDIISPVALALADESTTGSVSESSRGREEASVKCHDAGISAKSSPATSGSGRFPLFPGILKE